MYLCKFGQNPSIGSKDNAWKRSYADADADADSDGIRTINNMSPPFGWGGHNEQLKFHAQLSWEWKKFYNLSKFTYSGNQNIFTWVKNHSILHRQVCIMVYNPQHRLQALKSYASSISVFLVWFGYCLTSRSTIFQSCWDWATTSRVFTSTLGSLKCLAQGHYTAVVGIEPGASRSGVRRSTTRATAAPFQYLMILYIRYIYYAFCKFCKCTEQRINT